MYVRMNTIFGDRDKVAAVVDFIEGRDRPMVEAAVGNGGLVTFVDGDGGIIVAASYWVDPARSSEAVLTDVRRGAELIAGGMVIADSYEVRALVRRSAAKRGAAVRLDRVQLESASLEDAVAFLGEVLLAELTRCEGLCTTEILVDAGSSSAIVFTVWDSNQAAEDARPAVEALRDRAADHGAKFVSVERYTLMGVSPQPALSATSG
jgi:hypothetical protein